MNAEVTQSPWHATTLLASGRTHRSFFPPWFAITVVAPLAALLVRFVADREHEHSVGRHNIALKLTVAPAVYGVRRARSLTPR